MSLKIFKAGILDTVQDIGRYGYQHLGINPGGAMDCYAAQIANLLVGNDPAEAVIEMHFPALTILFQNESIIALSGADFAPAINGEPIPLLHPVLVSKNSILQFQKIQSGNCCYLAFSGGMELNKWLNSFSTNLKAAAGGYLGRALQKDDTIPLKKDLAFFPAVKHKDFKILPWKADENFLPFTTVSHNENKEKSNAPGHEERFFVIAGRDWNTLTEKSKKILLTQPFQITASSDRMGYRMKGPSLNCTAKEEFLSSAVSFGTIQLLPDGQLIILMADHQTTGGYPMPAQVVTAHLSPLAQKRPGEMIRFELTDQQSAEKLLLQQHRHLRQLENACKFRLEEYLKQ